MTALWTLALLSITEPRAVAERLMALRLGHEAILLAFGVVVVLNAVFFAATLMIAPMDGPLQPALSNPVIFMLLLGGSLGVAAIALTWTGRAMGGEARLEDMGLLLIWLQGLRVVLQAASMILITVSSLLAAVVAMAGSVIGVWILVNFVSAAHGFDSLAKATLVLVLGLIGMALGLTVFLSLIGATTRLGLNEYV